MLRARGGSRDWPRGVIQSKIGPFRLFVSSDLAPETPFCNYLDINVRQLKVVTDLPFRRCEQRSPHLRQGACPLNLARSGVKSQKRDALAAAYDK
jgi:hypothetical protein